MFRFQKTHSNDHGRIQSRRAKEIKQRLKRSREVIIEASDQAWMNSNANH